MMSQIGKMLVSRIGRTSSEISSTFLERKSKILSKKPFTNQIKHFINLILYVFEF